MSQTLRNIQKSRQGVRPTWCHSRPCWSSSKAKLPAHCPSTLSPDRMVRIALTAFRMNPKLAQTDPRSVFAAVIQSSQLGLEVGLMGEAHLVPFRQSVPVDPRLSGPHEAGPQQRHRAGHLRSRSSHQRQVRHRPGP
jgi:recombination protein RecT